MRDTVEIMMGKWSLFEPAIMSVPVMRVLSLKCAAATYALILCVLATGSSHGASPVSDCPIDPLSTKEGRAEARYGNEPTAQQKRAQRGYQAALAASGAMDGVGYDPTLEYTATCINRDGEFDVDFGTCHEYVTKELLDFHEGGLRSFCSNVDTMSYDECLPASNVGQSERFRGSSGIQRFVERDHVQLVYPNSESVKIDRKGDVLHVSPNEGIKEYQLTVLELHDVKLDPVDYRPECNTAIFESPYGDYIWYPRDLNLIARYNLGVLELEKDKEGWGLFYHPGAPRTVISYYKSEYSDTARAQYANGASGLLSSVELAVDDGVVAANRERYRSWLRGQLGFQEETVEQPVEKKASPSLGSNVNIASVEDLETGPANLSMSDPVETYFVIVPVEYYFAAVGQSAGQAAGNFVQMNLSARQFEYDLSVARSTFKSCYPDCETAQVQPLAKLLAQKDRYYLNRGVMEKSNAQMGVGFARNYNMLVSTATGEYDNGILQSCESEFLVWQKKFMNHYWEKSAIRKGTENVMQGNLLAAMLGGMEANGSGSEDSLKRDALKASMDVYEDYRVCRDGYEVYLALK